MLVQVLALNRRSRDKTAKYFNFSTEHVWCIILFPVNYNALLLFTHLCHLGVHGDLYSGSHQHNPHDQ